MQGKNLPPDKLEKLKQEMMSLWHETFSDSWEYIKLIFEAYFNPDNVFVSFDEDILSAALLAVPYSFRIPANNCTYEQYSSIYLCGLATRPAYRNKGIMGTLMSECEKEFCSRGYDFTFLIPANEHLRVYYRKKGYEDMSFLHKGTLGIRSDYNNNEDLITYQLKDLHDAGYEGLLYEIAHWCREKELNSTVPTIIHSLNDWITIFSENENSLLLCETTFDLKYPILAKIVAVVFPIIENTELASVEIKGIFQRSESHAIVSQSEYIDRSIISTLIRKYVGKEIRTNFPYNIGESISDDLEAYAMMKSLRKRTSIPLNNIPIIQIYLMLD